MAATIALVHSEVPNSHMSNARVVMIAMTPDNSYPTGGYSMPAGSFGLTQIYQVHCSVRGSTTAANAGYVAAYDYTNAKVQLFRQSAATGPLTEVNNTNNTLTAVVIDLLAIGA